MAATVPSSSLVVLIGPSSAGKSRLAQQHFRLSEVVSSDRCRLMLADDENDQSVTAEAFDLLHHIVDRRLAAGRLTVVDATNLKAEDRRPLLSLAEDRFVPAVALLLDCSLATVRVRNEQRGDRHLADEVLVAQVELARSVTEEQLHSEGFEQVLRYDAEDRAQLDATIERVPGHTDRSECSGPFDIIGDVHGCREELVALLVKLGYEVDEGQATAAHPAGRTALFVGDLVDRGPDSPGVMRLVMGMVRDGAALCLPGNHEARLLRSLQGHDVGRDHGLGETLDQLAEGQVDQGPLVEFIRGLPTHMVLDGGRLVVAHAGLPEPMHNRSSPRVRRFALYGETTGEVDAYGQRVRYAWARDYRGAATVVYGHTPVTTPRWENNTFCVDTGCVYGGALTALRYPEREAVSVPALAVHYALAQPFIVDLDGDGAGDGNGGGNGDSTGTGIGMGNGAGDGGGAAEDAATSVGEAGLNGSTGAAVLGTGDPGAVDVDGGRPTLGELEAAFAENSLALAWLVHRPAPAAPAPAGPRGEPEHPTAAFAAFAEAGYAQAVCEYQHTGSPAVAVVCRDVDAAAHRFGVSAAIGGVYQADGTALGDGPEDAKVLLDGLHDGLSAIGLWDEVDSEWVVVELVSLGDGRVAPVTLVAGSAGVWAGHDRRWHLSVAERLHDAAPALVTATRFTTVTLGDVHSQAEAIAWWGDVVAAGGRGMVVWPLGEAVSPQGGAALPSALACRASALAFGRDPSGERERPYEAACAAEAAQFRALGRLVAGAPLDEVRAQLG